MTTPIIPVVPVLPTAAAVKRKSLFAGQTYVMFAERTTTIHGLFGANNDDVLMFAEKL